VKTIFWQEGGVLKFIVTGYCHDKLFASPVWTFYHTSAPPFSVVRAAVKKAKARVSADIERWNTALDTK